MRRVPLSTIRPMLALAIASVLAGCGADLGSSLLTAETGRGDVTTATVDDRASAFAPAPNQKQAFTPFAEPGTGEGPAREVIANPTLAEVLAPGPLPEFSLGRADAPVVVVKYMSLTCQHCRRFMATAFPTLKREYIDTGKVRLVIREFPIGRTSGNATIALRCAPMSQYLTLYQKFLERQSAWVSQEVRPDAIAKIAAEVGVTRSQYDACIANQPMIAGLSQVKDRGRQLGIIGTPNFFIGNRLVKTVLGIEEFRAIVDPMLAAGNAGTARRAG